MQTLRIVPPELEEGDNYTRTRGTRVFVGDVELNYVTDIQITSDLPGSWQCTLKLSKIIID